MAIINFNTDDSIEKSTLLFEFLYDNISGNNEKGVVIYLNSREWRFYSDLMKRHILGMCDNFISDSMKSEIQSTMYSFNEDLLKDLKLKIIEELYDTYKWFLDIPNLEGNINRFRFSEHCTFEFKLLGNTYSFNYSSDKFYLNKQKKDVPYEYINIVLSINLMRNISTYRLLCGYTVEENYRLFPELKIINDSYKLLNDARSL